MSDATGGGASRWKTFGERVIYDNPWVWLGQVDVELPDGERFWHHVVRLHRAAMMVLVDEQDRVLLLWRHRFTTDTWGWEIPAGRVDPGETAAQAAVRETIEESGYRPGPLRLMTSYFPHNGVSDATFHLFRTDRADFVGAPTDTDEAERVEWLPWSSVLAEAGAGRIGDGLSLTALLWAHGIAAEPPA